MRSEMSVVYLLHFDQPFGHARHYLGWASRLEERLRHHEAGTGANLLKHARAAGVTWVLARTWEGDRHLERRLHNGGHARRCPVCKGQSSDSGVSLDSLLPMPHLESVRQPSLGSLVSRSDALGQLSRHGNDA